MSEPDQSTPSPAPVLSAKDAEILRYLRAHHDRIVDVGRYRRSWTPDDIDRVARRWLYRPRTPHNVRTVILSPAQQAVLTELCRGQMNAEIGRALGLAENTVKDHIKALNAACGTRHRLELVVAIFAGRFNVKVRQESRRAARFDAHDINGGTR